MGKAFLIGFIAALVLSTGSLCAQDSSGDDSGPSDTGASDNSGPSDNSDPDSDPGVSPDSVAQPSDPTDPTAVDNLDNFAAQQAHDAITTPWGGVPSPIALENAGQPSPSGNPVPAGRGNPSAIPVPSTTGAPSPRRTQIHAVIVSNLSDPSQVLSGNVDLTGGIVALGPPTPSLKPGRWDPRVRIIPDPDLLNGSKIPPLSRM